MTITTSDGTRPSLRRFFFLWSHLLWMMLPTGLFGGAYWYVTGSLAMLPTLFALTIVLFADFAWSERPDHPINRNQWRRALVGASLIILIATFTFGDGWRVEAALTFVQRIGLGGMIVSHILYSVMLKSIDVWERTEGVDAKVSAGKKMVWTILALGVALPLSLTLFTTPSS